MSEEFSPEELQWALDEASDYLRDIVYVSPAVRTVAVLAAGVTHITKAFSHVPRIKLYGEMGTGKSTLLTGLQHLVQLPVRNSGLSSTQWAYRNDFRSNCVDKQVPTSIIDETAHIFGPTGKNGGNHPLYTILTDGYDKAGAPIKFQEKEINQEYSCYQVCFLASKDKEALPPDVIDRSIELTLTKKPKGMKLVPVNDPDATAAGEECGKFLRSALQRGAEFIKLLARDEDWYDYAKLDDRTADKWVPLFAIAVAAGGEWPERIKAAYEELGAKNGRNLPSRLQVQVDIWNYTRPKSINPERMVAKDLITYLRDLGRACYEWDEAPFTLKRFGMLLSQVGVQSVKQNSVAYYRVTPDWLKQAERLAKPKTVEVSDPENDWSVLDEFIEEEVSTD